MFPKANVAVGKHPHRNRRRRRRRSWKQSFAAAFVLGAAKGKADEVDAIAVEKLRLGERLRVNQPLVSSAGASASLAPLWVSAGVSQCTAQQCQILLSADGELSVYTIGYQARKVSVVCAATATATATLTAGSDVWLELLQSGDIVVISASPLARGETSPTILWSSGSAFPLDCDAACKEGASLVARADGSLALRRGVSATMQAYLDVGAPAVARLRSCLFENGFRADAFAGTSGGAAAPPEGRRVGDGDCRVPPPLILSTFPNSGTSYTLTAVRRLTGAAVFDSYDEAVKRAHEDTPELQDLCGLDACTDLGMCISRGGASHLERGVPPPGKGALVKCHAVGYLNDYGCHKENCISQFEDAMTAGGRREPYGFLRLFRNPFDNLVARHHSLAKSYEFVPYTREGFLAGDGRFPKRDIFAYLFWHLNANLALKAMGKPTAVLYYEDMYTSPTSYLRAVLTLLGWSEEEVTDLALIEEHAKHIMVRNITRLEDGTVVPFYIDSFYDAETISFVADAIQRALSYTNCMQDPHYMSGA